MSKEFSSGSTRGQSEYGEHHRSEKASPKQTIPDKGVIFDIKSECMIMGSGNEPILVRFPEEPQKQQSVPKNPSDLTPKEIKTLDLLAQGLPQREIADKLGISRQSLVNDLTQKKEDLQADSTVDIVLAAAWKGDITVDIPPDFPETLYTLTHKEFVVAQALIQDPSATRKDIVEETDIDSIHTVRDVVGELKKKFDSRNTTNLALKLILGTEKIRDFYKNQDSS